MKRYWRSLQFRLVISYLGLSLLVLSIVGFTFSAVLRTYAYFVQQQRVAEYVARVQALAEQARAAKLSPAEFQARLQQELPQVEIIDSAMVRDELRTVLPQRPNRESEAAPEREMDRLATRVMIFSGVRAGPAPEWRLPYTSGSAGTTLMLLRVRPEPGAALQSLMYQVIGVLAAIFLLAGLIGWWLSRWLARSLGRLADATAAVASGNFQQNVEPTGVNELDRLAEQFNQMVQNLRETFRSLQSERDLARRFAGDAAHELRTPVAALRAYADVLEDRPERLDAVMPGLGRQVGRMEGVIQGLLELSRLSEGTGTVLEPGDLGEIVRQSHGALDAMAEDYDHTLRLTVPAEPVPVRLDRRLLEAVLQNLVENACKFTPEGGEVAIAVELGADGSALLTVSDNGPGIPQDELPFIFERFHRGVGTQSIPGTGLGLAIVKEAVARLGASVEVQSGMGEGSRFTVRLPLAHHQA